MKGNPDETRQIKANNASRNEIRMAKTFAWIVATYIICYAPLTLNFLIVASTENVKVFQTHWLLRLFHVFSICIAHFNSVLNPFIYAYRIKDVREAMKDVFRKIMCGGFDLGCCKKSVTVMEQRSRESEETL